VRQNHVESEPKMVRGQYYYSDDDSEEAREDGDVKEDVIDDTEAARQIPFQ
jgi:hypothetical protein